MHVRPFDPPDEKAVVALWDRCGLLRPWNNPQKDIARKLLVQPELFLVGLVEGRIVATVMAGYDGHRGWINYFAVEPSSRRQGCGRMLMTAAEDRLLTLGCPKINLQIRHDNLDAIQFYEQLGFSQDAAVSFGKRLVRDD